MERNDPRSRSDAYGSRINRSHSSLLANVVPWVSIMVRPGLMPIWAGMPLGLLDDLYNGQPFGFAIFTWSLIMIVIELIETRLPWRTFWQDWFTACILIFGYLLAGWLLSGGQPTFHSLIALIPQLVLTILLFPIAARLVAMLDRFRLTRWKAL